MKNRICIFCGNVANTREHIPAKHFFKGTLNKNLIVVPSCLACNRSFQPDEDFFRQFFVSILIDKSDTAKNMMDNEIASSIKQKPALGRQMFNQMELVDFFTKSGLYLGQKTMYKITDLDKERIKRVAIKIIKGLFYNEFGTVIPEDWIIKIMWITPKLEREQKLEELAKTLKWNVIKEDIFAYGVNYVPETFQSIWILDFFKVPLFYILVLDKKTAKIQQSFNRYD